MSAALLPLSFTPPGKASPPSKNFLQRHRYQAPTSTVEVNLPEQGRPKFRASSLRFPHELRFAAVNHPSIRVKKPFAVQLTRTGGTVAAYCEELEEFGYGPNISASLDDLGKTLVELFFSLEAQREDLGPDLTRIRERLAEHIEVPRRRF